MSENSEIRNLDLALLWADVEGAQKRGVLLPGATGKALANRINEKLRAIDANLPENPRLRRRSLATITRLTVAGLLDRKLSAEITKALHKPLDVIPAVDSRGLRPKMREVKDRAWNEMGDVVEEERLIAPLSRVIIQDSLERAVDTANAIRNWMAPETWVYEYFSRKYYSEVTIYKTPVLSALNGIYTGVVITPLVFMFSSKTPADSLVLNSIVSAIGLTGLLYNNYLDGKLIKFDVKGLTDGVTPIDGEYIQEKSDNNVTWPVRILSSLDRVKTAQKIQTAIN